MMDTASWKKGTPASRGIGALDAISFAHGAASAQTARTRYCGTFSCASAAENVGLCMIRRCGLQCAKKTARADDQTQEAVTDSLRGEKRDAGLTVDQLMGRQRVEQRGGRAVAGIDARRGADRV